MLKRDAYAEGFDHGLEAGKRRIPLTTESITAAHAQHAPSCDYADFLMAVRWAEQAHEVGANITAET